MYAAVSGQRDVLRVLLEQRPTAQAQLLALTDTNGDTALHHAARHGHTDVVQLLITLRADITAKNSSAGDTSVHLGGRLFVCVRCIYNCVQAPVVYCSTEAVSARRWPPSV
jgi:E3 ubiquitin-protein ligase XBAT32/33